MKKTYFILSVICALTSCKSAIDKPITEPLSNKEMVEICKDHSDLGLEKALAYIGSEESYVRQFGKELFLKYGDVTYRDIVEYRKKAMDKDMMEGFHEKYHQYTSPLCDSAWKKINDIRESIKRDTSFNKYAKVNYTLEEKEYPNIYPYPWIYKKISPDAVVYDNEIRKLGGIVSKVSKEGSANPNISFNYFCVKVDPYINLFTQNPVDDKDTLDFVSGEYDYAFNVLWVETRDDILYTSKENWDLLESGSSHFDLHVEKDNILDNRRLLEITNIDIISQDEFVDSLFREQLNERTRRAREFYWQISR